MLILKDNHTASKLRTVYPPQAALRSSESDEDTNSQVSCVMQ